MKRLVAFDLFGMEDSVKNKLDSLFFTPLFVLKRHK